VRFADVVAKVETSSLDPRRPLIVAGPGGLYEVVDVRDYNGTLCLEICKLDRGVYAKKAPRRRRKRAARDANPG